MTADMPVRSRRCEGDRAVRINIETQSALRRKHVEMGKRLTERLTWISVQYPREYLLRDRERGCFAGYNGGYRVETGVMMFAHLSEPCVQRAKRQTVRGQHECVRR